MQPFCLQDLQLDNPDAVHLLSLFLGRAIVDEILPPSFLTAVLSTLEDHSEGVSVIQSTGEVSVTQCTDGVTVTQGTGEVSVKGSTGEVSVTQSAG